MEWIRLSPLLMVMWNNVPWALMVLSSQFDGNSVLFASSYKPILSTRFYKNVESWWSLFGKHQCTIFRRIVITSQTSLVYRESEVSGIPGLYLVSYRTRWDLTIFAFLQRPHISSPCYAIISNYYSHAWPCIINTYIFLTQARTHEINAIYVVLQQRGFCLGEEENCLLSSSLLSLVLVLFRYYKQRSIYVAC